MRGIFQRQCKFLRSGGGGASAEIQNILVVNLTVDPDTGYYVIDPGTGYIEKDPDTS